MIYIGIFILAFFFLIRFSYRLGNLMEQGAVDLSVHSTKAAADDQKKKYDKNDI